jgi:nucleoside-diphosphate-sugar epimerase
VPFVDDELIHSVIDLETEVARFSERGGRGIALRFGAFYGPDARSVDELLGIARRGIAPYLGSPEAYMSSIHTDDAARAVVAALDAPTGEYNVCDEPMTRRDVADAFAAAFRLKRQRFVPGFAQRIATRGRGDVLLRSQRVSNAKLRSAVGWAPEFPNAQVGFVDVAARKGRSS